MLEENVIERIEGRQAIVGVIGLGYVGLPLAAASAEAGFKTVGFDIDPNKPAKLNSGESYIAAVSDTTLSKIVANGSFAATTDMSRLEECDVIVICVPTPLTRQREPNLEFIESTTQTIAKTLRRGQTIILESTTYPGTTTDVLVPILEATSLKSGRDFFVGFSPEREDPGNEDFGTVSIPKIVSGHGENAARAVQKFYSMFIGHVIPVSTTSTAEAIKITENIFRAVNIALVNELKTVFDAMGIDVWEVIEGAKSKPFGYMPFYPGPGLGGHCIPVDPFYLTWRAREFDISTRFIELAGEVNRAMPAYVVNRLSEELDRRFGVSLSRAHILLVGLAYKKNVRDTRESPAFKIMELLDQRGAQISYHDPNVPAFPHTREHSRFSDYNSVPLGASTLAGIDAVVIITDHDDVDYKLLADEARLIIDTRNAMSARGLKGSVAKA